MADISVVVLTMGDRPESLRAAIESARAQRGVDIELLWGSDDRIGDRPFAATLPGVTTTVVENADHQLPLTHPSVCLERLATLAQAVD